MALILETLEPSYALVGAAPVYNLKFYDSVTMMPADPDSVESVEVLDNTGATVIRAYIPPDIQHPAAGLYFVSDLPIDTPNTYKIRWTYIEAGVERRAIFAFEVVSQPTHNNDLKVKQYTLLQLGKGVINVELPAGTLDMCLDMAKMWFAMGMGQSKRAQLMLTPGTLKYDLQPDVGYVTNVAFQGSALSVENALSGFGIFGMEQVGVDLVPVDNVLSFNGEGVYSQLVQVMAYSEMASRINSTEPSWDWNRYERKLYVFPTPPIAGLIYYDYVSSTVDMSNLYPDEFLLIQQRVLAEAKETLGRIRSKFSGYAMAQGEKSLDGDTLLNEAATMKMDLDTRIMNYAPAGWMVIG